MDAAEVVEGLDVLVDSVVVVVVRAAESSGEIVSARRAVARDRCCARGRAVGGEIRGYKGALVGIQCARSER